MHAPEAFTTDGRRLTKGKWVAVDCDYPGAALTLSHHWGGNATPAPLRHDLASGAALLWAASPEREEFLGGARWVYNDHFDVDGFLAAWVALNPDEARGIRQAVLDAAAAGDFDEWTTEPAVKFAILGEWIDDPRFSRVAREGLGLAGKTSSEALYAAVLGELPDLLVHPESLEELWRRPYGELLKQLRLFEKGDARVEERPARKLSVVHTPRVLPQRAIVAKARGDRLLQVVHTGGGFLYVFRHRPMLGYRIVSRPLAPAHDAASLARELNRRWPAEGEKWRARGWWTRELWLSGRRGARNGLARSEPEAVLPVFEEVLEEFDSSDPSARTRD